VELFFLQQQEHQRFSSTEPEEFWPVRAQGLKETIVLKPPPPIPTFELQHPFVYASPSPPSNPAIRLQIPPMETTYRHFNDTVMIVVTAMQGLTVLMIASKNPIVTINHPA
jgi:hypothetical protein